MSTGRPSDGIGALPSGCPATGGGGVTVGPRHDLREECGGLGAGDLAVRAEAATRAGDRQSGRRESVDRRGVWVGSRERP